MEEKKLMAKASVFAKISSPGNTRAVF